MFAALGAACMAGTTVRSAPAGAVLSCQDPVVTSAAEPPAVTWRLAGEDDRAALDAWCRGVGAAVYGTPAPAAHLRAGARLAVVSWNVNVGGGDLDALVADLRAGRLSHGRPVEHFVLLLQEALRRGPAVPAIDGVQSGARRLVRSDRPVEIDAFAREAGLSLFYVPSMRNGFVGEGAAEDRGNAILSTLPLTDLRAIELPFERQRRVAAAATIVVPVDTPSGPLDVPIAVASVHLDPFVSGRRLWLAGVAGARQRQARAVADAIPSSGPLLIGGDFNTWLGLDEPALAEMRRISDPGPLPREATFVNGRVLDYLFFRIPAPGRWASARAPETYGSDHYPLVGWIELQ
jgi:endonuclease/exonuclease/phosphatase family metal-dependent hydrolase